MSYYKTNGHDVTGENLKSEGITSSMLDKAHKIANKRGFMNICEYAQYYGFVNGFEACRDLLKVY